jgi:hypothetical protein
MPIILKGMKPEKEYPVLLTNQSSPRMNGVWYASEEKSQDGVSYISLKRKPRRTNPRIKNTEAMRKLKEFIQDKKLNP